MVSIDAYIWCCGWWLSSCMASIDALVWSVLIIYLVLWVVVEL